MPLAFGPLSRRAISTLNDLPLVATVAAAVGAVPIYLAEIVPPSGSAVRVATEQYATLYTDSRPSLPFNGTLAKAPSYKRSIKSGSTFGGIASGFGPLSIYNGSGEYDTTLLATPMNGAFVTVWFGWRGTSFDRFIQIFTGLVDNVDNQGDTVVLNMQDDNKRLEIPVSPNIYGGTGGLDGDSNVKGKRKPLALGTYANATAVLIDATNLVYQINDGAVDDTSTVYDRGVALTVDANYSSYANLLAATIPAGKFGKCNSQGVFRLGAKADGLVTCSGGGALSNGLVAAAASGAAISDTARIVHYLITNSGANIVVDAGSIITVALAQGATIGYVVGPDDTKTLRQAIDELMTGIGGYASFRSDRSFQIGIFTLPTGAVVADLSEKDWFADIQQPALPDSYKIPPRRVRVGYSRNWTIQSEIDAAIDAGTQTLRNAPWSVAISTDTTTSNAIAAAWPASTDSDIVEAFFSSSADAITEANRRLVLAGGAMRALFRGDFTELGLVPDIGQVIRLTDNTATPRYGLNTPKSLTVVEIDNGFDDGVISVEAFG